MAGENYLLRGARNTLLDTLLEPIGTTYPLFDLPVSAKADVVYYGEPAELVIGTTQPDVLYQIYEGGTRPLPAKHSETRTDLTLNTAVLKEQVHAFRIKATKRFPGIDAKAPGAKPSPLTNNLFRVVNVRVGINAGLEVTADKSGIINYGEKIALTISTAQKGAFYSIIYYKSDINNLDIAQLMDVTTGPPPQTITIDGVEAIRVSEQVVGDNADLTLETFYGLREDMDLRIAVIDKNTDLSGVLKAVTHISVGPDLAIGTAWVSDDNIVYNKTGAADHNSKVSIKLISSQQSVSYTVRLDAIDSTDNKPAVGDLLCGWITGTAESLILPLHATVTEDMMVTVMAKKTIAGIEGEILSRVFIAVYPDTGTKATTISNPDPEEDGKAVKITSPQRDIIYRLRHVDTGELLAPPVFYHRNLGIGHTRIGQSFIATNYKEGDHIGEDWWVNSLFAVDKINPDNDKDQNVVILPAGVLAEDTQFEVIATKSTTGFSKVITTVKVKAK